jgi:hypothetical protein
MIAELSIQRDFVFGMPSSLNITGVGVDVVRDTSVVSPIDGDMTKIKKYMTLTLYNGSVNEHLDLDIPLGTITAVSAVKAIQISHQQGISIHHIDSTNIDSILPILQVSSEVKTNIQNAVNAGYEVIVPEREILYAGWQGTGYIIQDPTTGAGACLISGGAAGGQILVSIGYLIAAHYIFFWSYTALIVEGEGECWIYTFLGFEFMDTENCAMMAAGATYLLGYLPLHKKIATKNEYLSEITYKERKILYHIGHGGTGSLSLYQGKEVVLASEIQSKPTDHFIFVYIDTCKSAGGICQAFKSKAALGWKGPVTWYYGWWFEARFWLECLKKIPIGEACRIAKYNTDRVTGQKYIPKLFGDTSIILKGEF